MYFGIVYDALVHVSCEHDSVCLHIRTIKSDQFTLKFINFTSIALPDEWQFQKILSCKLCGQWMFVSRTATDRKIYVLLTRKIETHTDDKGLKFKVNFFIRTQSNWSKLIL